MEELEAMKVAEAYKAKGESQQLTSLDSVKQEPGL
jgi:hypothetical protein